MAGLGRVASPGSSLAITISLAPKSRSEANRRARLQRSVSAVGEPLMTAIPRAQLGQLFEDAGWSIQRAVDPVGVDIDRSPRSSAFVTATKPASRV
jgi:hypothetical protein